MSGKKHPSDQAIMKYISGELAENTEMRIGEHIAGCMRCLEKSRTAFKYSVLLKNWTAKLHGEIYWRARISKALESLRKSTPNLSIRNRVESWIKEREGKVGGVIQIAVSEATAKATIITDLPRSLLADAAAWKFVEAAVVQGEKRGEDVIEIISKEKPRLQLLLNFREHRMIAQMEESAKQAPLIVVAPKNSKAVSIEPKKVEGTNFYSASLENIPLTDTAIIVEARERLSPKKKTP